MVVSKNRQARDARRALQLAEDPTIVPHGTLSTYTNWKCRCVPCRGANTAAVAAARKERADRLAADPTLAVHGKNSTYLNWGCRCTPCREAHAIAGRR